MIDQLHLMIRDYTCTCGNRWTHSTTLLAGSDGTLGGRPSPKQEAELPMKAFDHYIYNTRYCFRCLPAEARLQFKVDWTKPTPSLETGNGKSIEDELLS